VNFWQQKKKNETPKVMGIIFSCGN